MMSHNNFTKQLNLSLETSPQLYLLILIPHLFAPMFLLFFPSERKIIIAPITLAIIFSLFYFLRLHYHKSLKKSVTSIHQDSANNWFIEVAHNEQQPVLLSPSSFESKSLIILNYVGINNVSYCALITPDCISRDDFRRLRVRLKSV